LLIARAEPAWVVALHRFIEVSAAIVAGCSSVRWGLSNRQAL
jgi:hypothetical protein